MSKKLKFRPYARLLTMLGDQLIKNEQIALIELIKNSYDADASWVQIRFENFGDKFEITKHSKIVIEDDGTGMTDEIIENAWMNPATPNKYNLKQKDVNSKTEKGRIVQGEKGIGRFAIFKLGYVIKITTRHFKDNNHESVLVYDFSKFNDDFTVENNKNKEIFLDDIEIDYLSQTPKMIVNKEITLKKRNITRKPYGTIIEITNLKGKWSSKKIIAMYDDIIKLESPFKKIMARKAGVKNQDDFVIDIWTHPNILKDKKNPIENLKVLLEQNVPLKIEHGIFDNEKNEFRFNLNEQKTVISFDDSRIMGIEIAKDTFVKENRKPKCGSFKFNFYVFDFSKEVPVKYQLDKKDKEIIKENRIYLYRDGIRVFPYGDKNNDWLGIDILRGIGRAGDYLSNDQVVGWIEITQKYNPKLKDKTNREGLIEIENSTTDFITVIQIFLKYLHNVPYKHYKKQNKSKEAQDVYKKKIVEKEIEHLKEHLKKKNDTIGEKELKKIEKDFNLERNFLVQRAEVTEELAGVGLSVETASHDIMLMMNKAMNILNNLIHDGLTNDMDIKIVMGEIEKLNGMLTFVHAQLSDIQLLFRSSKRRKKNIHIEEMLNKVINIFKRDFKDSGIEYKVDVKIGSPLVVKCSEAVILQLLINLFDNAIYWLELNEKNKERCILITLDGDNGELYFSDNGPGVHAVIEPNIFDAFYTGKGEGGRGLGLYIARQLLERNEYSIELISRNKDKKLSGANFLVSFIKKED